MINICFNDIACQYLREAKLISKDAIINVDLDNIIAINLQLDYGSISDNGLGPERCGLLKKFHDGYVFGEEMPSTYDGGFKRYMHSLEKLKASIGKGETFRIWYTEDNCEYCNFCWLLSIFNELDAQNIIYVVRLPAEVTLPDGEYERKYNTSSFMPEELFELVSEQTVLSESRKNYYVEQWKRAVEENTNLRLVLYGNIVSVNEDFYDQAIMVEAEKYEEVINEAQLVGRCVARLGLTDLFVGKRIEYMIDKGIFEVVCLPATGTPFYCKKIKRT